MNKGVGEGRDVEKVQETPEKREQDMDFMTGRRRYREEWVVRSGEEGSQAHSVDYRHNCGSWMRQQGKQGTVGDRGICGGSLGSPRGSREG